MVIKIQVIQVIIIFKTNQMNVPTQINCNAVYFLNSTKVNAIVTKIIILDNSWESSGFDCGKHQLDFSKKTNFNWFSPPGNGRAVQSVG